MQTFACAIATILLLGVSIPLRAHHGSAPHYDPDDHVRLDGVVTELRFVNPHAFVYFDAVDASGESVPWRCGLSGATLLRRQGWTPETLVPGHRIEIVGAKARREDNACAMESIVFADGSAIVNQDRQQADSRPVVDPVINCESGNIITDWYRQSHVNDIRQSEDRIVLRYGYLEMLRTVFLNSEHPENVTPSVEGHSIGWWEDDVLVVDTIGLTARVLIPLAGVMISDQAHVVERFQYDEEGQTLFRDYTVQDPLYLNKPYSGRNVSDIASEPYRPFDCVNLSGDNNRRNSQELADED